ncbi:hypothetical protein [Pseudomonas sp. BF-B-25]|uniref:hypothetical protein n=1 Tax=Pseudomonas sp. BF-B-25 TaxID=2832355 RepID=UPI001CBA8D9B|nr:hypothetical protein [Pseudomonas sp. BF-B-25]
MAIATQAAIMLRTVIARLIEKVILRYVVFLLSRQVTFCCLDNLSFRFERLPAQNGLANCGQRLSGGAFRFMAGSSDLR